MKTFETPVCEVKAFEVVDVLTTSQTPECNGDLGAGEF